MIGESPARPGILYDMPEVVVTPEILPAAATTLQLMVPW